MRSRPFLLQLTDIYPSNIFVDRDWNFMTIIDLEWMCALPAEMLYALPPSLAPLDSSFPEASPCPRKYD